MTNILHAIDTTGPGGAETVFIELLSRLERPQYNATVVIRGRGWVHDELCRRGYKPYIVDAKGSFNLAYLFRLIKIIRKERIDIIQSHLFGSNVYCCLAGWLSHTPVITTFHGAVDFSGERFLQAKFRIINTIAKAIVVVSENLKSQLLEKVSLNPGKLKVIYNGIDTNKFQPDKNDSLRKELALTASDVIVGSIGNIRRPKAYEILLRAAAIVVEQSPNIKFVIVGENKNTLYDELIKLRGELKLENNVFFLGFRANVPEIMNGFDLFLLSSRTEGFSISTIEAMACGIPVTATKSGGPQEIITNKQDGMLVEVDSSTQIAAAILGFVKDPQLQSQLKTNALDTVKTRFAIDAMLNKYKALYLNVSP